MPLVTGISGYQGLFAYLGFYIPVAIWLGGFAAWHVDDTQKPAYVWVVLIGWQFLWQVQLRTTITA
jgi:hypothetical protein